MCSLNMAIHRVSQQPYRDNKAPLLEVFDQRDGVLFEVGQAAVDGLGVVVGPPLLLGSLLQPLLQAVAGAGQEHHQVGGADLKREREGGVDHSSFLICTRALLKIKSSLSVRSGEIEYLFLSFFFLPPALTA